MLFRRYRLIGLQANRSDAHEAAIEVVQQMLDFRCSLCLAELHQPAMVCAEQLGQMYIYVDVIIQ